MAANAQHLPPIAVHMAKNGRRPPNFPLQGNTKHNPSMGQHFPLPSPQTRRCFASIDRDNAETNSLRRRQSSYPPFVARNPPKKT